MFAARRNTCYGYVSAHHILLTHRDRWVLDFSRIGDCPLVQQGVGVEMRAGDLHQAVLVRFEVLRGCAPDSPTGGAPARLPVTPPPASAPKQWRSDDHQTVGDTPPAPLGCRGRQDDVGVLPLIP